MTVLDDGFVHFIVAIVAMRYVLSNIKKNNDSFGKKNSILCFQMHSVVQQIYV